MATTLDAPGSGHNLWGSLRVFAQNEALSAGAVKASPVYALPRWVQRISFNAQFTFSGTSNLVMALHTGNQDDELYLADVGLQQLKNAATSPWPLHLEYTVACNYVQVVVLSSAAATLNCFAATRW